MYIEINIINSTEKMFTHNVELTFIKFLLVL